MNNLIFIHKGQRLIKRILAGIFFILAILSLVLGEKPLNIKEWLEAAAFILIGIMNCTRLAGSTQSYIRIEDSTLRILWRGWVLESVIPENEIEKIVLGKGAVIINRKDKKPEKILLHETEKDQRTEVYKFMIEYSKNRNISLEKQSL